MHHHYDDIRGKIDQEPFWFDENAVPRYCEFSPRQTANIYAEECALVLIHCRGCDHPFRVCFSWSDWAWITSQVPRLSERVKDLHYGDPPNTGCCDAGPTMNSIPIRVLEFHRFDGFDWERVSELETHLDPLPDMKHEEE